VVFGGQRKIEGDRSGRCVLALCNGSRRSATATHCKLANPSSLDLAVLSPVSSAQSFTPPPPPPPHTHSMKISAIQAIAILLPCIALQVAALKLGFVGLGAMGKHMAGHLQKSAFCNTANPLQVWNRGAGVAEVHAQCYGSQSVSLEALSLCDVIFLSLPNTAVVVEVLGALMSLNLRPGSLIVDTTSGEPAATAVISADLRKIGVRFVDCPVSGGPAGAEAGVYNSVYTLV
jgi:hypothetical protein